MEFRNPDSFVKFATLFSQPRLHHLCLLRHINDLSIEGAALASHSLSDHNNIVVVLMQIRNLRRLALWDNRSGPMILSISSQMCVAHLRQVELYLYSEAVPAALMNLRECVLVRILGLSISAPEKEGSVMIEDALRWDWPNLHTLKLAIYHTSMSIAPFLCRCNFPALRKLSLSTLQKQDLTRSLSQFLAALALDCLDISKPSSKDNLAIMLSCVRTTSLKVYTDNPTQVLRDNIPSSVQELQLCWESGVWGACDLLDWLLQISERTNIRSIRIVEMGGWTWTGVCEEDGPIEAAEIHQLMGYASRLFQKGISLRDGEGKTVMDYFK
jgi:hypothetical protein